VFTLEATICGYTIKPSEHESLEAVGKVLNAALDEFGLGLSHLIMSAFLTLVQRDLEDRISWTWAGAEIYIRVGRTSTP
jgi:hypothetical protein